MPGDINPVIDLYHALVFILTADWAQLEPYVKRVLTIAFYVFGLIYLWKALKKK
jgi:hypothetical protein